MRTAFRWGAWWGIAGGCLLSNCRGFDDATALASAGAASVDDPGSVAGGGGADASTKDTSDSGGAAAEGGGISGDRPEEGGASGDTDSGVGVAGVSGNGQAGDPNSPEDWRLYGGLMAKAVAWPYALSSTINDAGDYIIMKAVGGGNWVPLPQGRAATSIAVSEHGELWTITNDNTVWLGYEVSPLHFTWSSYPTNICDGGSITLRQVPGDNAIAVGLRPTNGYQAYVIEGGTATNTTLWWTGACWLRMPEVPSGTAKSIALYPNPAEGYNLDSIWLTTTAGTIYRWDGYQTGSWILISGTNSLGLDGVGHSIGADGSSLWLFDASRGSFTYDDSWSNGRILDVAGDALIDADGSVWRSGKTDG